MSGQIDLIKKYEAFDKISGVHGGIISRNNQLKNKKKRWEGLIRGENRKGNDGEFEIFKKCSLFQKWHWSVILCWKFNLREKMTKIGACLKNNPEIQQRGNPFILSNYLIGQKNVGQNFLSPMKNFVTFVRRTFCPMLKFQIHVFYCHFFHKKG